MERRCNVCERLFQINDQVEILVRTRFVNPLKAGVNSLATDELEAINGTIVHVECADDEDQHSHIGFNN